MFTCLQCCLFGFSKILRKSDHMHFMELFSYSLYTHTHIHAHTHTLYAHTIPHTQSCLFTHYRHAHIHTCAHFNECTMISVVVVGVLLQSINCLHRLLSILIAHKRIKTALKTTTIQLNMLYERKLNCIRYISIHPAQVNVNFKQNGTHCISHKHS